MLNFTSGTTGDSKGVKVSHWSLLSSIIVQDEMSDNNHTDVFFDYMPAAHAFAQLMFVSVLFIGAS